MILLARPGRLWAGARV